MPLLSGGVLRRGAVLDEVVVIVTTSDLTRWLRRWPRVDGSAH
jgi:hypothetical protein